MKVKLYETVEIIEDIQTDSLPSVLVRKGTLGNVVDILTSENGDELYLVELDNDLYPDGVVERFKLSQIKKWTK